MVGEVNLIATLGPAGAGPSPQDGEAMAAGGNFSALLDEATGAVPEMPETAAGKNPGINRIAAPVFIAEWCFAGSDAAAVQPDKVAAVAADEPAETESESDDADSGELALDGVLNIDWLLAQPKRMIPVVRDGEGGEPAAGNGDATAKPVAVNAASNPAADPAANTLNMRTKVEATAAEATEPTEAIDATAASGLSDLASAKVEGREHANSTPAARPKPAKALETIVAPAAAAAVETAAANVAAHPQVPAPTSDAERPAVEPTRGSSASSRLAKAIERLTGGAVDAGVAQAMPAMQDDASASNNGTSFSSSNPEHAAANAGTFRAATASAPAFTVHVAPEVPRTAEIVSRAVEAPLPSNPDVPSTDTVHQLVQTMRLQFRDGIGDAVVRLRPEHLGEVSISLRVDQQTVSATVHAEQATVRQWLESQESSLRNGLAEHGLELTKFVVREDGEQQKQQPESHEDAQRRNRQARRQRRGEAEPRFEITV